MTYNAATPATPDEPGSAGAQSAPGRPIREYTDPFVLEVHRAIEVEWSGRCGRGLAPLPTYVTREHDAPLREIVQHAVDGASGLAVLVGGSSSGKTRACWEAVQGLPVGWRLWHPIAPSRPEATLGELDRVLPCTVVWLNEIHHYLLTATDSLGERLAAKLHALLQSPERAPVLVLGTAWPEHWATLTTPPSADGPDPYAQARALLTGPGKDIVVADRFSETDLRSLRIAAQDDPRLAYAADHAEQGQITQYIAGAPALVNRYRTAPPGAKALIEAAMDARRLGHSPALPLTLLEAAAAGYLTDQQRDLLAEDWLERSLAYATASLYGIRGPLARIRPGQDGPAYAQPHYLLADYLEQHGRATRALALAPSAMWTALTRHASHASSSELARSAERRGLMRLQIHFLSSATAAGDHEAIPKLIHALTFSGRAEEALPWYRRACDLYRRSPKAMSPWDLFSARRSLLAAGYQEGQLPGVEEGTPQWYQNLAENADSAWGVENFATHIRDESGMKAALAWLQQAVNAGNLSALATATKMLAKSGRVDEALAWFQRAAQRGNPAYPYEAACYETGELLCEEGRLDEALIWFQRASDIDAEFAGLIALTVAEKLSEAGRVDDALIWFQRAAAMHGLTSDFEDLPTWALFNLGEALETAGMSVVPSWVQDRAEAGDTVAFTLVVVVLHRAGKSDELLDWLRERAGTGDLMAMIFLADGFSALRGLRVPVEEAGFWFDRTLSYCLSVEGARDVEQRLTRWGPRSKELQLFSSALDIVVHFLDEADRSEEADVFIREHAAAGDSDASKKLAARLGAAGHAAEALEWYERSLATGDYSVLEKMSRELSKMGRTDEAITWRQRAAEAAPDDHCLSRDVHSLLTKAGRIEEAEEYQRYGLEPDGTVAARWQAPPPQVSG
ncbi:tetratricopeptide repeat protein [Streptomyces sp. NBC_01565]|uniref:tetratricopeptide repeat protein n=1 Tax=Streptomyces sp. NBC_01565 TaxID=2975881 RepID=UPI002252333D|nr:tetratricopeptide repeat protein [Streptomyces sp. NBC_01565]MCX4546567.1 tetratricopeptide repeat protein [Streptomyces sp. NBC_01565]